MLATESVGLITLLFSHDAFSFLNDILISGLRDVLEIASIRDTYRLPRDP